MTDAATTCLRAAADCLALARLVPSGADLACEFVMAAADLPPDLAAQVEAALSCGNYGRLDELADALEPPPRRKRRTSLARLVAKAKQLGVDVTVEPNGTATFRTGSSTSAADTPQTEFDEWIAKHAH
jgi:hypothetical protein